MQICFSKFLIVSNCISCEIIWAYITSKWSSLCDKVCQWLVAGQWFSSSTLVSSTNKTDRHDIAKILLKVALNTINSIIDLFCENGFLMAILHQVSEWLLFNTTTEQFFSYIMVLHRRQNLRCDMWWEVHFKQNISAIVSLLRIYQCYVNIITSC